MSPFFDIFRPSPPSPGCLLPFLRWRWRPGLPSRGPQEEKLRDFAPKSGILPRQLAGPPCAGWGNQLAVPIRLQAGRSEIGTVWDSPPVWLRASQNSHGDRGLRAWGMVWCIVGITAPCAGRGTPRCEFLMKCHRHPSVERPASGSSLYSSASRRE